MINLSQAHLFVNSSFKKMKVINSKSRNRLDCERLESGVRVTTSQILPGLENLVASIQQTPHTSSSIYNFSSYPAICLIYYCIFYVCLCSTCMYHTFTRNEPVQHPLQRFDGGELKAPKHVTYFLPFNYFVMKVVFG
jgi:hypothetical protein